MGLAFRQPLYEDPYFERAGPISNHVFTDLDRLSRYETENLQRFARAVRTAAPQARILNQPLPSLALAHAGINDFSVIRLDTGERPKRYPVFSRTEDGHLGPESDLLHDNEALDAGLAREVKPRRGRIAIGFAGKKGPDGLYLKYSPFNVGGRSSPTSSHQRPTVKDAVALRDPAQVATELNFFGRGPRHVDLQ